MKKTIAYLLPSVAFLLYIMNIIGIADIVDALFTVNPYLIVCVFVITVSYSLIDCFKWHLLIDKIKRISLLWLVPIYFAGELFNALTPGAKSGGEVIKAHYVSKVSGLPQSRVYASILIDKSIHMFVFFILIVFSVVYTTLFLEMPSFFTSIFRVVVSFAAILSVAAIVVSMKIGRYKHRTIFRLLNFVYHFRFFEALRVKFKTYKAFEDFVVEAFTEFLESLNLLIGHTKGVGANILLSLFMFSLTFLKVWIIFFALGYSQAIIPIIIVVCLGSVVSYVVFTPGGAGVTEIALISLYVAVGVDPHVAAVVTLIDRSMYYVVSFGVGYLANIYMRFKI